MLWLYDFEENELINREISSECKTLDGQTLDGIIGSECLSSPPTTSYQSFLDVIGIIISVTDDIFC